MASAAFLLNGVIPSGANLFTAGATVIASVADLVGAGQITFRFVGASESVTYPTLTITGNGTVSFTVPSNPSHGFGLSLLLECVNGDDVARAVVCVGTTTQIASMESTERGVLGWIPQLNANHRSSTILLNSTPVNSIATDESITTTIAGGVATLSVPSVTRTDETVGLSLLSSTALVWGSSLSATPTTIGGLVPDSWWTTASVDGLSVSVGAVGSGSDSTEKAITLTLNTANSNHHFNQTWLAAFPGLQMSTPGVRTTLRFKLRGTKDATVLMLNGSAIQGSIGLASHLMSMIAPKIERAVHWPRADGWVLVELTFLMSAEYMYWMPNGTGVYTADGATLQIAGLEIRQEHTSAVANLSSGSAATITSSAGPDYERASAPLEGWHDRTTALCFRQSAATLAVSVVHTNLSGTDAPFSFSWLWCPYSEVSSDAAILSVTGATASLVLKHTTGNKLTLTRTNNDGTSLAITFANRVGLVPTMCSIVFDGERANLWIQDRCVEGLAFKTSKACTFTATAIGSAALRARFAELAMFGRALLTREVLAVHSALSARRSHSIEPIKLWLQIGQSNQRARGQGILYNSWFVPNTGGSIHFEQGPPADTAIKDDGWGPSRFLAPVGHRKEQTFGVTYSGYNEPGNNNYGQEMYFHAGLGRIATVRVAYGGVNVSQFLPGGNCNELLLTALSRMQAEIGIPWTLEGFMVVWGEADTDTLAHASGFPDAIEGVCGYIAGLLGGSSSYKIVMNKLHVNYAGLAENVTAMRSAEVNWATAAPNSRGLVSIDEIPLTGDNVHWVDPAQIIAGTKLAESANRLRAIARS